MKKLFAMLLVVVLVLSMAACGGQKAANAPKQEATKATVKPANEAEFAAAEAEIRYALGLLLDRNYICEEIGQAGQVPASSFVAMGLTDADGSEFYKNCGVSEEYLGYYNTAVEATYTITGDECAVTVEYEVDGRSQGASNTVGVRNSKGSTLPSTGGIGTTIFYVIGGVLVLAAIVLLITKKRMSAEN